MLLTCFHNLNIWLCGSFGYGCPEIFPQAAPFKRTVYKFFAIFAKVDKFCDFLYGFLNTKPLLEKGLF